MRAFNLVVFMVVVVALAIVVWAGLRNGSIALGGYPAGQSHPEQIQMSRSRCPEPLAGTEYDP